ncbi:MucBP domain-containing protein [Enterococcus sp. AZ192]|uniref:MucBP domain-containing protein n=1 Tax=unclassified Enterococcus TaxID=2608891 RepID=UPI003D2A15FD
MKKRKSLVLLGTILLCTTQLAPMISYSMESGTLNQSNTSTLYNENSEEMMTSPKQDLSDQSIMESERIEEQTNQETQNEVNETENPLADSTQTLVDDKNEIEKAADAQESNVIQGLADSLGTLEQLIPKNPEAVADISENLGILPTDEVTQEQLDTITTLRASAGDWEGFQYLTNLTELVIFTGIGHPENNVQYLLPLKQLETLTYDGSGGNEHTLVPNGTSKKSSVDLTQFNELLDNGFPLNVNFMNLDVTAYTPSYKYAIANPFIDREGAVSQELSIDSPSSDIFYDEENGMFFTEIADGTMVVPSNNLIDELYFADNEWKIQYYFTMVNFNVPVYGDFVIEADSEISYHANTSISEATFLSDIHAKYAAKLPIESDVIITSNFSENVDFNQPGEYTVQLDTKLSSTIDSRANAKPVEVIVTILPEISGDVIVKYVDTEGNSIADEIIKSGSIGEDYTTEKQEIAGYTFKEVQGNVSGKFTNQLQTVTYVYTKNTESAGDVIVRYVDTTGHPIADEIVKSGKIGEGYTTEKQEITGYTFKEAQGNTAGTFTNQVQTVTYIYTKNKENISSPAPKPQSPSNNGQGYEKNDTTKDALPALGETDHLTLNILGMIIMAVTAIILLFRKRTQEK